MSELMAQLKSAFNVILVDSPPLGAGIDPFVLGAATGHMVLVLRSGETDRAMAEEKLKLVDRLPIRLLGAVLNDVDTKQAGTSTTPTSTATRRRMSTRRSGRERNQRGQAGRQGGREAVKNAEGAHRGAPLLRSAHLPRCRPAPPSSRTPSASPIHPP